MITKQFSLLIKPASFNCNLRCKYCFYLPKEELFGAGLHRMSLETFEQLAIAFYKNDMPSYDFAFQGGEATLLGLEFFQEVVKIQRKHLPAGKRFTNSLQTNGTLIDNNFARFLQKQGFLIGISIDGPKHIHDLHRKNAAGGGSYDAVIKGLTALKKNKTEFNTLTLVSSANVNEPKKIYHHMKELGSTFHQYIECVETSDSGIAYDFALKQGEYGKFMCGIFDAWYPNDIRKISVRLFDSIINKMLTGRPTMCTMGNDCRNYFVVEYDGSIYPCDFFVEKRLNMGNVSDEDSFTKALYSKQYQDFGLQKGLIAPECNNCKYVNLCMGDCLKNRKIHCKSFLCADWKIFYGHTFDKFQKIAYDLSRTL